MGTLTACAKSSVMLMLANRRLISTAACGAFGFGGSKRFDGMVWSHVGLARAESLGVKCIITTDELGRRPARALFKGRLKRCRSSRMSGVADSKINSALSASNSNGPCDF